MFDYHNYIDYVDDIILFGAVFIVGFGWCMSTIIRYRYWSSKRKNCIKELPVQVIEIWERRTSRGAILHKPIFAGTDENASCIIDSAVFSNLVSFEVGQRVVLLVNPENPKQFLYKDNKYNKGIIVDFLGCFLPLIFLLGIILAMKS